jgi:hypothetical protein
MGMIKDKAWQEQQQVLHSTHAQILYQTANAGRRQAT